MGKVDTHCGNQTECNFNVIIQGWGGGEKQSLKPYAYYNSLKYIFPPLTRRLSKQIIMERLEIVWKKTAAVTKSFFF